jgi:hypothetical protein
MLRDEKNVAIRADGYPLSFLKHPLQLRFLPHWLASLKRAEPSPNIPWITFACSRWLGRHLDTHHKVFEYGSGGSTKWFAERVSELVSVEHNPAWYEKVSKSLRFFINTTILLRVPSLKISEFEPARSFTFEEHRELDFQDYVESINSFPNNYFDVIFIDGRAREACLKAAIPKLKSGGFVVLDNSERERYVSAYTKLGYKVHKHFLGIGPGLRSVWRTSVLRAP